MEHTGGFHNFIIDFIKLSYFLKLSAKRSGHFPDGNSMLLIQIVIQQIVADGPVQHIVPGLGRGGYILINNTLPQSVAADSHLFDCAEINQSGYGSSSPHKDIGPVLGQAL
ncbi:hypothetical protein SDC9_203831 [bioreactor metagenome]|uniref:Uncharacterized protein n=1 Tax=bioreactor metagenome TaxID=1076179 RepID=A0A645IXI7_9ZZZZ